MATLGRKTGPHERELPDLDRLLELLGTDRPEHRERLREIAKTYLLDRELEEQQRPPTRARDELKRLERELNRAVEAFRGLGLGARDDLSGALLDAYRSERRAGRSPPTPDLGRVQAAAEEVRALHGIALAALRRHEGASRGRPREPEHRRTALELARLWRDVHGTWPGRHHNRDRGREEGPFFELARAFFTPLRKAGGIEDLVREVAAVGRKSSSRPE